MACVFNVISAVIKYIALEKFNSYD